MGYHLAGRRSLISPLHDPHCRLHPYNAAACSRQSSTSNQPATPSSAVQHQHRHHRQQPSTASAATAAGWAAVQIRAERSGAVVPSVPAAAWSDGIASCLRAAHRSRAGPPAPLGQVMLAISGRVSTVQPPPSAANHPARPGGLGEGRSRRRYRCLEPGYLAARR